jgi:crotonobetaine/carnitine-CoA ligase
VISPSLPADEDCVLAAMLDKHAEERPGEVAAVFDDGQTWTWEQARAAVRVTAGALRDLGVREGDLVGMWLPTGRAAVRLWWAVNWLGAVLVPINTAYRGPLLEHVLRDSGVTLLVAHHELVDRLRDVRRDGLRDVVPVGGRPDLPGVTVHDESVLWSAVIPARVPAVRRPWDLQVVIYTSGTTGPSKGVRVGYLHAATSARAAYAYLTATDRFLVNLPLFHISGIGGVLTALLTGGSVALAADFSTGTFWEVLRRTGSTTLVLMGVMATFLLKAPPRPDDRDNPLRTVLMVPLAVDSHEFSGRFGCDVYTVFNMTEISSPLVAGPQPAPIGTCGQVRPGIEARLVDEYDREVPDGAIGELILRAGTPWTMTDGYLNDPAATAHAWRNGWFHTGDAFKRDADGNYFFADRIKDAIRRRGENISSYELEAVVARHAAVREVAAVAVPSPIGEDDVLVVVAPVEGFEVDAEELLRFLIPLLPHYMVPRYVRSVAELPKTPTAKIQKHLLRADGVTGDTYDREKHDFVVERERLS